MKSLPSGGYENVSYVMLGRLKEQHTSSASSSEVSSSSPMLTSSFSTCLPLPDPLGTLEVEPEAMEGFVAP